MISTSISLDPIRPTSDPADRRLIRCPGCDDALVLHQLDERLPDRLLGTCLECTSWFLLDRAAEVMVRLPDVEALLGTQLSPQMAVA